MPPKFPSGWKCLRKDLFDLLVNGNRAAQDFSSELKQRLSRINLNESANGRSLSVSMSAQVFVDQHSTPEEVSDWLRKKGFQD